MLKIYEQQGTKRRMTFWVKAVIWTVVSFAGGAIGGYIAEYLTAPFYFGFFFAWVLIGLIGMFMMAVHVTNEQLQR